MTNAEIIEKVTEYYANEIKDIKNSIELNHFEPAKLVNNSLQRCLGVAFFAQYLEVPFKEVDALYEEQRAKLYKFLEGEKI